MLNAVRRYQCLSKSEGSFLEVAVAYSYFPFPRVCPLKFLFLPQSSFIVHCPDVFEILH